MGVPAFFRWLTEKYPDALQDILEIRHPILPEKLDLTLPPPDENAPQADNLYIDMNGIIHPCSHPENGIQPSTEDEMYQNVCDYVDRLFNAIRPKRLLYLAIDGVAPRAKMNQQRSRRFRSAQEMREKKEMEEGIRKSLVEQGVKNVPAVNPEWDSNVITPGTPFMLNLSKFIQKYVERKIKTDPAWAAIQILFSDASIPGEGEHKIMSHVRLQRASEGYCPNKVHVLHGLDADLIMLALATHEAHFYILREEVVFGRHGVEESEKRKKDSGWEDRQRELDDEVGVEAMEEKNNKFSKTFQRLSIPILREYLALEFEEVLRTVTFERNFERLIDDVVFLCFFVGNDFLPHLPSLDIRDGALDFLFNVYKRVLPDLGGYLTSDGGTVDLKRINVILGEVGSIEDHVFQMRHEMEEKSRRYHQRNKNRNQDPTKGRQAAPPKVTGRSQTILNKRKEQEGVALGRGFEYKEQERKRLKGVDVTAKPQKPDDIKVEEDTKTEEDKQLDKELFEDSDCNPEDDKEQTEEQKEEDIKLFKDRVKQGQQDKLDACKETVVDNVRFHEPGWKDRYYSDKCKADDVANHGGRTHLFKQYILGLSWVMKYYYTGVPSWKWYFPFHYAPFASDLKDCHSWFRACDLEFEICDPFYPVEQLMGVLPEDSSHAIPQAARWLMGKNESPILDFYPKEILCDPNGKAMPWLWVVLLPFIEEDRLLKALKPTVAKWTEEEKKCNKRGEGDAILFISSDTPPAKVLKADKKSSDQQALVFGDPGSDWMGALGNVTKSHPSKSSKGAVWKMVFHEPDYNLHKSELLKGSQAPPPKIKPQTFRIRRPRLNRGGLNIASMGGNRNDPSRHQRNGNHQNPNNRFRGNNAPYNVGKILPPNQQWNQIEPHIHNQRSFRPRGGGHHKPKWQAPPHQHAPPPPPQGNYGMPQPPSSFGRNGPSGHVAPPQQFPFPPPPGGGNQYSAYPPPPGGGGTSNYQTLPPTNQNSYNNNYQQGSQGGNSGGQNYGYSFNRNGGQNRQQPQRNSQGGNNNVNLNPNVLSSLRSQLASTIKQNRGSDSNHNSGGGRR